MLFGQSFATLGIAVFPLSPCMARIRVAALNFGLVNAGSRGVAADRDAISYDA